jgi:hypothetical protein
MLNVLDDNGNVDFDIDIDVMEIPTRLDMKTPFFKLHLLIVAPILNVVLC